LIKDHRMTSAEYELAQTNLPILRKLLEDDSLVREQALLPYIYCLITVYGHAWCMDVKSERIKMSLLISEELQEYLGA